MKKGTKKFDRNQFLIETRGMTPSQITKYALMSDAEKIKFVALIRKDLPKPEKGNQKSVIIPVKVIKEDQVCVKSLSQLKLISVMVLNMRGKPLMTTSPGKARTLLKKGN